MGTLEKVMQMRQMGQNDSQIIDVLKREGVSPKEIQESLSQSKIKSALSQGSEQEHEAAPSFQQMQPSIMQSQEQFPENSQQIPSSYQPSTVSSDYYPQQNAPAPNETYQEYYPEYAGGSDMETVNEIADQIVEEKTVQIKKQIDSFSKFRDDIILEVEKINERMSRVENTLNELQIAIIGKIGEYGRDIKDIAKEMHSTQDSFSKILNPLADTMRQMQGISGEDQTRPRPKTKTEKKSEKVNFEDYLR